MNTACREISRMLERLRRIRHRNGYGVHSPFAYHFIKDVVYERGRYYAYAPLRERRRATPVAERTVAGRVDRLMFRVANYCQPAACCFVGRGAALTSLYAAAGCRRASVSLAGDAQGFRPAAGCGFVYVAPGEDFAEAFRRFASAATDAALFAAAGIHASRSARQAWTEICADERAVVTFDLYEIGLVFFRRDLNKQSYVVSF